MTIIASCAKGTGTLADWSCTTRRIFGGARRPLSDRYGLVVTLCEECHRTAEWAVHRDADTMQWLHEYGQRKAMREQGWSVDDFRRVFGKSYIEEDKEC